MESPLQVSVGRGECPSPHGLANRFGRGLWALVALLLFRPTPRPADAWRRFLLRAFGARIGAGARIMPSVRIWAPWNLQMGACACLGDRVDCYCVDRISVGPHATVSQEAFLCTASHDIHDPHMRLVTAPITIGDQAWVCARVLVAPGITVGQGAVCGACAVVTHDVPPWTVVAGSPARPLGPRTIRDSHA